MAKKGGKKDKEPRKTPIKKEDLSGKDKEEVKLASSDKEIQDVRRLRQNLYNKKYRAKKKISSAKTKRERLRLNRQVLEIQSEIIEKNKELGYVRQFVEVPEERLTIDEQGAIQKTILPVWEARDKITDLIKGGYYQVYIVGEDEYLKKEIAEVYEAFSNLEDYVYSYGRKTPYVVFIEDVSIKEVSINIY